MSFQIPVTSSVQSFEQCAELVNLIRYQLGDPHELYDEYSFRGGSVFGLMEKQRSLDNYFRHTANFAWVLLETFFTGGVPEMKSPMFSLKGCPRRWQFVANFLRGSETIKDEIDIHLQCLDCSDTSIEADIKMDLNRGTEKIGEDIVSHVYFDSMVEKHVIYTGAMKHTAAEDVGDADSQPDEDKITDAFTILGSFNLKDCCEDRMHDPEPDFQTSFYAE